MRWQVTALLQNLGGVSSTPPTPSAQCVMVESDFRIAVAPGPTDDVNESPGLEQCACDALPKAGDPDVGSFFKYANIGAAGIQS